MQFNGHNAQATQCLHALSRYQQKLPTQPANYSQLLKPGLT